MKRLCPRDIVQPLIARTGIKISGWGEKKPLFSVNSYKQVRGGKKEAWGVINNKKR